MRVLRLALCFTPDALHSPALSRGIGACDALILPELFEGGYAALRAGTGSPLPDSRHLNTLRDLSRKHRLTCIAGSVFAGDAAGRKTNTCFVFRRGKDIYRYDKIHLFNAAGDHRFFSPGTGLGTFALFAGGTRLRAGVIICYDLRFPEMVRVMALQGLQVLFVPARWPLKRDDAWQALLKARAIENQIFVVGCNSGDKEGGPSYVFDPLGRSLLPRHAPANLAFVTLKLGALREAQHLHRNLHDARFLRLMKIPPRLTPRTLRVRHTSKRKSKAG